MRQPVTIEVVRQAFHAPLPGYDAQARMATRPRGAPAVPHERPPIESAVLALLYRTGAQLCLLLTVRSERVAHHQRQISLPGGALEKDDVSLWHAGLREAVEEVSVDSQAIEFIGELTPLYVPVSNFRIHPFVGYAVERPRLVPDSSEVTELIEMPLQTILDLRAKGEETWVRRGLQMQVPFYRYQGGVIWGATAMILSEVEVILSAELERQVRECLSL